MSRKKPNIILITSDQQHWSTIGKLNPEIKTPNLDKLAQEGTLFTNCYSTDPTCTPSRASILTGKYPSQHGAWSLGTRLHPEENILLTNLLKEAGYKTILIGKAHFEPLAKTEKYPSIETTENLSNLDFWREFHGPYYGFDHVEMHRGHGNTSEVGEHYALWLDEKIPYWRDYFEEPVGNLPRLSFLTGVNLPQRWKLPEKYHHSRWIEEKTIEQLNQFKETEDNFFMWVSFCDPHYPNICPEPWFSLHDPKKISVPYKRREEHRSSNPILKITQNRFMKSIVRIVSWFQYLIWKQKMKRNIHSDRKSSEKGSNSNFNIEKVITRLRKIPGLTKLFPIIDYYTDFIDNEQKIHPIHGLHPHVNLKRNHAQSIATIYGSVSLLDDCIGNILSNLEENGQKENTIILFTSDHGDHTIGNHGLFFKGPFSYDDGMKVPLIVRIPKSQKKGKNSNSYVSLMDVAPTVLSYAGLEIPKEMNGINQIQVFNGTQKEARDHIICEFRQSPTKTLMNTFITEHFKIAFYYGEEYGELFDLKKDPNENTNLWNDHRYEKLKLRLMLKFISKRNSEDFEKYEKIWKEFSIQQLFHVVWEYMQLSYRSNLMPRIHGA